MLTIDIRPNNLFNSLHDLIRMAFPGCVLQQGCYDGNGKHITITSTELEDQILFTGIIRMDGKITEDRQDYLLKPDGLDQRHRIRYLARRFVYRLLSQHLDRNFNAYGILTGVRPVKIVHRLLDDGLDGDAIIACLENEYLITPEKARLLLEVASINRPFLLSPDEAARKISIYIGIPFCPSRCYYCSFPGAVLNDYEREIGPFVDSLIKEMKIIGDYIKNNGLEVQTIYMGGGTPTVLSENDLARIFDILHCSYITRATDEITVEAGRPDTLSLSRLRLLKQAGVDRVCINPQTMNDDTLELIGRKHNCRMVIDAAEWARYAGIKHINMDIIVGLPGENREHFSTSAERILSIKPDNITVHTLAVKRGSNMVEAEGRGNSIERVAEVEWGVNFFDNIFRKRDYYPYYLYRQKYMKASMENTGYSLDDSFCIYNIQMIEERQTIIGLGGGASSKFVNASDWTLSTLHNPKDPYSYTKTVEKLTTRKVDKLRALN